MITSTCATTLKLKLLVGFLTLCMYVCVFCLYTHVVVTYYTSIYTAQNVTSFSTNVTEQGKYILIIVFIIATSWWFLLIQPIAWMYSEIVCL